MKKLLWMPLWILLALTACKERVEDRSGRQVGHEQEKSGPKIQYYTCSMHSFIRQDGPGKCPICGMTLVPVYEQSTSHEHGAETQRSAPASRGPVSLSETKRQLIGVRTQPVGKRTLTREIDAAGRVAYDPDLLVAQSDYLVALRSGGGALGGLQGGLTQAAKRRLQLLGMSESQIAQLRKRGKPDYNLLVPEPGQAVLVYASVFESDLPWIHPGMSLRAELPGAGTVYTTQLDSVDPTLDPMTRNATIRFSLSNPEGKLKPDMYLKVTLNSEETSVLAIPNEAAIDTGPRQLAYIETQPGNFEAREIRLGRRGTDYVEVLEGLKEGESVVVNGNFLLDSESRLRHSGLEEEGHRH